MSENENAIRVHICWIVHRNMPEVMEIERDSFEFPWTEEDFIRCLGQMNIHGFVAEYDGRVAGWLSNPLQW